MLEALDMEHMSIPSSKANPVETEVFYAEILAELATRMISLESKKS